MKHASCFLPFRLTFFALAFLFFTPVVRAISGFGQNPQSEIRNPKLTCLPSIAISASPGSVVCVGTPVLFTATVENGGDAPVFQWKKNGQPVGSNSPTFSDATLVYADRVSCELTSNDPCAMPATVVSNSIFMQFLTAIEPYVWMAAYDGQQFCPGQTAHFEAFISDGGPSPSFQWKVNGLPVGTDSPTFSDAFFLDGDVISCDVTSSLSCASPMVKSTSLPLAVANEYAASVQIYCPAGEAICAGMSRWFYLYQTSGGGLFPTFEWKRNGLPTGEITGAFLAENLQIGDVITCEMTSSMPCAVPQPAVSNAMTMVQGSFQPQVSIDVPNGWPVCPNSTETFVANTFLPGDAPVFQWKKNGLDVGSNSPTFTASDLQFGDLIWCEMTSNSPCASSPVATSGVVQVSAFSTYLYIWESVNHTCSGTEITFTSSTDLPGDASVFQWTKNGQPVGSNSPTYTDATLVTGDVIRCELVSSHPCVPPTPVFSNEITMYFTDELTPTANLYYSASTLLCADGPLDLVVYGDYWGAAPSFQWKKNGQPVGPNAFHFSPVGVMNGDVFSCEITSGLSCAVPQTVESGGVQISILEPVEPSVSIYSSQGTAICSGDPRDFYVNNYSLQGDYPFFQWKKNGVNVGYNSTYYHDASVQVGDVVICELTSSLNCAIPKTVSSNQLIFEQGYFQPALSISSSTWPLCPQSDETFMVDWTYLPGDAPVFQWKKNGQPVGSGGTTFTANDLQFHDVITCEMTSNSPCASPLTVESGAIQTYPLSPSVYFQASEYSVCAGSAVTFTASWQNGGDAPVFQWTKNGQPVGDNSPVYVEPSIQSGDYFAVDMTSNDPCVQPTTSFYGYVSLNVFNSIETYAQIYSNGPTTVCPGTPVSFQANGYNLGNSPFYQWKIDGQPVGGNLPTFESSTFEDGDVVSCEITSGYSCAVPQPAISNEMVVSVPTTLLPVIGIFPYNSLEICGEATLGFGVNVVDFSGSDPVLLWKKNGVPIPGSNQFYIYLTVQVGDVITCEMTSSLTCAEPQTVESNSLAVVQGFFQPGISIGSNSWPICPVNEEVFVVNGLYLEGDAPVFQWKKNGENVGSGGQSLAISGLASGDWITCELTSNSFCASPLMVVSNSIYVETYSASVGIGASTNGVCIGTPITYTAFPYNGGDAPVFQWKKNGQPVGDNSPTYTDATIQNGDEILVEMISNDPCVPSEPVNSGSFYATIYTELPVEAFIYANSPVEGCPGETASFYAYGNYLGYSPTYQWMRNGSPVMGATEYYFSTTDYLNGDIFTCEITSEFSCGVPSPAVSNGIQMTVWESVLPTVSIGSVYGLEICDPTAGYFYVSATTFAGNSPSFQWKINGQPVGYNQSYLYGETVQIGDVITCEMTSSLTCAVPQTVASNELVMVPIQAAPGIGISVYSWPVCPANEETFYVNGLYLAGDSPSFQWKKNGQPVGFNQSEYTDSGLLFGDVITCELTSNSPCASPLTATSNAISVDAYSAYVYIGQSTDGVCVGTPISFYAYQNAGGDSPVFQWKKNGQPVGDNSWTYTDAAIAPGDFITVEMTSSDPCVNEPTVVSQPVYPTVYTELPVEAFIYANSPIEGCPGETASFYAYGNYLGNYPTYQWMKNGSPVMGETQYYFSTTDFANGDIFTCEITSELSCGQPKPAVSNGIQMTVWESVLPTLSIYSGNSLEICDPTTGYFYVAATAFGGNYPVFQWKKNGQSVGYNTNYLYETVQVGDVIICEMTSSLTCAVPQTVASNELTLLPGQFYPAVYITPTNSPVCPTTEETFYVYSTYLPGDAPVFEWKKNGQPVGDNSATLVISDLEFTDQITCEMTSNSPCAVPGAVVSNTLYVDQYGPSIYIWANDNGVCTGSPVSFSANWYAGGDAPGFQWKKNGQPVGDNSPDYLEPSVQPGDIFTCELISSDPCASPSMALSNEIYLLVFDEIPFSASIYLDGPTTICANSGAAFYVTADGLGNYPTYQWLKNGQPVGENQYSYYDTGLADGDVISCQITSGFSCAVPQTITTNSITMTVANELLPTVSISSQSMGAACPGEAIYFNVDNATNAGYNPWFQWKKNGNIVGYYGSWYDYYPATGDVITCEMYSSLGCAVPQVVQSNEIIETVHPLPPVPTLNLPTICLDYSQPEGLVSLTGGSPSGGDYLVQNWGYNDIYPTIMGVGNFPVNYRIQDELTGCWSPWTDAANLELSNCGNPCQAIIFKTEPSCYPSGLVLSALPGAYAYSHGFQWKKNGIDLPGANYFATLVHEPGAYSVIITDPQGCVAESAPMNVTDLIPEEPVSVVPVAPVCISELPIQLSNGSPAGGIYWGPGVFSDGAGGYLFGPDTLGAGSYQIRYSGCSNEVWFEMEVLPLPTGSLEPVGPVCENELPVLLDGEPIGGIFSGTGVENGVFHPSVAGVGSHEITYSWQSEAGCQNESTQTVVVNAAPTASLAPISPLCTVSPTVVLTGGNPAGGQFSGPGVSAGVFDAAAAGAGVHEIHYFFENGDGCSDEATQTVVVNLPVICPADREINLNSACKLVVPSLVGDVQTNCLEGVTVTQSPTAGLAVPKMHGQTQTVVVTVHSTNFGSFSCPVVLTAKDVTPPVFIPSPPISVACPTGVIYSNMTPQCKITIPNIAAFYKASDNCNGVSIKQSPSPGGPAISVVHDQLFVITLTATDAAGNTATCTRNLRARDVTKPDITTCPPARTVPLSLACKLTVPDLAPELVATDGCTPPLTTTQNPLAGAVLNSAPGMMHTITMTVKDAANNSKTCSVKLTGVPTGSGCSLAMAGHDSDRIETEKVVNFIEKTIEYNPEIAEKQLEFQTMPNPFSDELTIAFDLSETSKTRLVLMDLTGQFQFFEKENWLEKGRQKVVWNTEDLPAGAYFVGLKTESAGWVWRKVVLVR